MIDADGSSRIRSTVDVGVLTVLREETYAIVEALRATAGYRKTEMAAGQRIHEAALVHGDRTIRIAAMQTTDRGQSSAALAFNELCTLARPRYVALVGTAGGINRTVEIGDVVIADSVISYDPRRVARNGVWHRGATRPVPVTVSRAVQDFLSSRPEPTLSTRAPSGRSRPFRVHYGPVGSGEAVITDVHSHIREFLFRFNEKVLAVETEAAAVAQAYHESARHPKGLAGWLVVRGISDKANRHKGHRDHAMASRHAVQTLEALLPFL